MQTLYQVICDVEKTLLQSGCFFGHGTETALDEAVYLVLTALSLPIDQQLSEKQLQAVVNDSQYGAVQRWLKRRSMEKKPMSYLTNEAWQRGLSFYVDERVLIPRSPIMELLENQCVPWVDPNGVKSVLDMCTGSGCLAIGAALYFEQAQVDAVDLSADALEVAQINKERYQDRLADRLSFYQGNLFSSLQSEKYDLIISNPPYVSAEEVAALPDEYHHEPLMALQSEDSGLALPIQILQQAADYLTETGVLILEVGFSAQALMDRFPQVSFTWVDFADGGEGVLVITRLELVQLFTPKS